jgi:hypothetical protein
LQPVEIKILSRIYGRGRGWAFTKTDFIADFDETSIHKALSLLEKSGRIRRVLRGVYDYPRYSGLLEQSLSPDIDQVAHAIARKFNWRIYPSGDVALNLLGLSTQVPAHWSYLSDGRDKEYEIGMQRLAFRKTALRDLGFTQPDSGLLVQALKALGKELVDDAVIEILRTRWSSTQKARILKDTRTVTGWIYSCIKRICID